MQRHFKVVLFFFFLVVISLTLLILAGWRVASYGVGDSGLREGVKGAEMPVIAFDSNFGFEPAVLGLPHALPTGGVLPGSDEMQNFFA